MFGVSSMAGKRDLAVVLITAFLLCLTVKTTDAVAVTTIDAVPFKNDSDPDNYRLVIEAADGKNNKIKLYDHRLYTVPPLPEGALSPAAFTVSDSSDVLSASSDSGCKVDKIFPNRATCYVKGAWFGVGSGDADPDYPSEGFPWLWGDTNSIDVIAGDKSDLVWTEIDDECSVSEPHWNFPAGIDIPLAILGGEGNDTIYGGCGADRLFGGPGSDYIAAGLDRDAWLQPVTDSLFAWPQDYDTVICDTGLDTVLKSADDKSAFCEGQSFYPSS